MKITFFEISRAEQSVFSQSLEGSDLVFYEEKLNENNTDLAKDTDIISVFVNSTINKEVIDALPNLKLVATRSTGFDHIDCEYAGIKGIKIATVPAYGSHTVAEFAFGLILNLSRKIANINGYLRQSLDFHYSPWMEGFNLEGKTLGVIGTGKIGKNVIKIAKGFEMKVLAFDLFPDLNFAKENNFEYKSLPEVLAVSDIITLHTPYSKENHHLINKENISLMKKGVYLINTARGELVDTTALVSGLKEGIIAGAGMDVLEDEKNMTALNCELIAMPNVIITPHTAFFTLEAVAAIQNTTVQNIQSFISGSPVNLVK